jgi:hypothetical protein
VNPGTAHVLTTMATRAGLTRLVRGALQQKAPRHPYRVFSSASSTALGGYTGDQETEQKSDAASKGAPSGAETVTTHPGIGPEQRRSRSEDPWPCRNSTDENRVPTSRNAFSASTGMSMSTVAAAQQRSSAPFLDTEQLATLNRSLDTLWEESKRQGSLADRPKDVQAKMKGAAEDALAKDFKGEAAVSEGEHRPNSGHLRIDASSSGQALVSASKQLHKGCCTTVMAQSALDRPSNLILVSELVAKGNKNLSGQLVSIAGCIVGYVNLKKPQKSLTLYAPWCFGLPFLHCRLLHSVSVSLVQLLNE